MADSQVSVGASLAYSWSLWRAHWREIWGVLALFSLAITVQLAGSFVDNDRLRVGGMVASFVIQLMVYGAVFRLAFADRHPADPGFAPGASGVHWGRMEWRMLIAQVLMAIFLLIVGSVIAIAAGAVAVGIAMSNGMKTPPATPEAFWASLGSTGQPVVTLVLIAAVAALLWFSVRLSLALAASADTGRVAVLKSWPLTKGQVLRIVAAMLLLQLPLVSLQLLVASIAVGDPSAGLEAMTPGAAFVSALLLGVVGGGVVAPMAAGVLAYFYRSVAGPPAPRSTPANGKISQP